MIARPPVERPILWPHAAPDEHWHTEVQTVFRYWRERHPANGLPGRQHIDPLDVVSLLPGIWLLDVQREPFRLRYRLVGTRVTESIGREVTGLWMDEAHPDASSVPGYFDRYRSVVDSAQPTGAKAGRSSTSTRTTRTSKTSCCRWRATDSRSTCSSSSPPSTRRRSWPCRRDPVERPKDFP